MEGNVSIVHKNKTAAEWETSTIIPAKGEMIIYSENPPKIKIGDGVNLAKNLPFLVAEGSVDFPITIAQGGTGATTASQARTSLGVNVKMEKILDEIAGVEPGAELEFSNYLTSYTFLLGRLAYSPAIGCLGGVNQLRLTGFYQPNSADHSLTMNSVDLTYDGNNPKIATVNYIAVQQLVNGTVSSLEGTRVRIGPIWGVRMQS